MKNLAELMVPCMGAWKLLFFACCFSQVTLAGEEWGHPALEWAEQEQQAGVTGLWALLAFCLVLPWLLLQSRRKTRSVVCYFGKEEVSRGEAGTPCCVAALQTPVHQASSLLVCSLFPPSPSS